AEWHGVSPDEVALSVGASDLLHRLVRAFVLPGGRGRVLSVHAPFGELARAAALQGSPVDVVCAVPNALPPETALVYVGHPHNPTGRVLPASELRVLADRCGASGALLVVDEAYAPFVELPPLSLARPPRHARLVRLLSPGKAHGLVGARPAYALAARDVAVRLDNLAPAWHLPASTAAVLAALPTAQEFLTRTLPQVSRDAAALAQALAGCGAVEHHGTPYVLLEVGNAASTAAALLLRGIRVRDCASYGLPQHLRISTRTASENAALLRELRRAPGQSGGRYG
ncbi:MAG: aminotransferase, class, partial [Deinococcus sp.]|nr:aminotransferase, class [Deinococcus sp.]